MMTDDEVRRVVEACARAAEAQDRIGHEWVRDSLWANILERAGSNVRSLKDPAVLRHHMFQIASEVAHTGSAT